jgi:small-conductance mechanosensitive channel
LLDVARRTSRLSVEPKPHVRFKRLGDSGLDFGCWVDTSVQRGWAVVSLDTAVYQRCMAGGIEIPYPKHDVYVREMPLRSQAG